jgi:hypothetical protein
LDPLRRIRVLAAALPGAAVVETVMPAPIETVWAVASDLETELPHLVLDVRSVRIEERDGERLRALIRGHTGLSDRFDVVLRPGWCWMEGRRVIGAMAAAPTTEGTRFALLGGLRITHHTGLGPPASLLAKPLLRHMATRMQQRVASRIATTR